MPGPGVRILECPAMGVCESSGDNQCDKHKLRLVYYPILKLLNHVAPCHGSSFSNDFTTQMAPRRGNTHPPPDLLSPNATSASPRSASPSSGFTQFLTKPSKWFTRSASASKPPSTNFEPRTSLSGGRKHKISHPTDPRPILDNHAGGASR